MLNAAASILAGLFEVKNDIVENQNTQRNLLEKSMTKLCEKCNSGFPSTSSSNVCFSCLISKGVGIDLHELLARNEELELIASQSQPDPVPNQSTPIVDLVMEDMKERKRIGIERYGTPLQANNGRDALRDAYEEALDLAIYLRQAIEERDVN